jgi:hypothetical protein
LMRSAARADVQHADAARAFCPVMKHLRTEVRLRHPTQYRFCARRLHVSPRQTSSTLAVNACRAAKTTSQCPIRLDLTFQHPGVHGVFEPLEFAYSLWGRSETARRRTHRPARSRKPLPDGLSFADHGSEAKPIFDSFEVVLTRFTLLEFGKIGKCSATFVAY